jgi:hypothetical protein
MEQITAAQFNSLSARTLPSSLPAHLRADILHTSTVLLSYSSNEDGPIYFVECVELEELTTEEILECINRGVLANIKFGAKSHSANVCCENWRYCSIH